MRKTPDQQFRVQCLVKRLLHCRTFIDENRSLAVKPAAIRLNRLHGFVVHVSFHRIAAECTLHLT